MKSTQEYIQNVETYNTDSILTHTIILQRMLLQISESKHTSENSALWEELRQVINCQLSACFITLQKRHQLLLRGSQANVSDSQSEKNSDIFTHTHGVGEDVSLTKCQRTFCIYPKCDCMYGDKHD